MSEDDRRAVWPQLPLDLPGGGGRGAVEAVGGPGVGWLTRAARGLMKIWRPAPYVPWITGIWPPRAAAVNHGVVPPQHPRSPDRPHVPPAGRSPVSRDPVPFPGPWFPIMATASRWPAVTGSGHRSPPVSRVSWPRPGRGGPGSRGPGAAGSRRSWPRCAPPVGPAVVAPALPAPRSWLRPGGGPADAWRWLPSFSATGRAAIARQRCSVRPAPLATLGPVDTPPAPRPPVREALTCTRESASRRPNRPRFWG